MIETQRQALVRWLPAIVWAMVISLLSSDYFSGDHTQGFLHPLLQALLPGASAETVHLVHAVLRKLAHVTEYAIFAVLVARALDRPERTPLAVGVTTLLVCVAYAALDETHQSYVPSRVGSPVDVLLDGAGAALGLALRTTVLALSAGRRSRA